MIWTIEARLPWAAAKYAFLFITIAIGAAIWLAAGALCWRQHSVPAVLVIFGLYSLTLLVQMLAVQRYVEQPILLTLAVFLMLQGRLPRLERDTWMVWFGVYGVLSWAKLFVGVGGFGQTVIPAATRGGLPDRLPGR